MNTRAARMTHENFQTSHSHLMWYAWKSLINVRNDTVCLVNKSIPFFVDFGMEQNGPICQYIICGRRKKIEFFFWSDIKVEIFWKELKNKCILKTDGFLMSQDCAVCTEGSMRRRFTYLPPRTGPGYERYFHRFISMHLIKLAIIFFVILL